MDKELIPCPFCGGNWLSGIEAEERQDRLHCKWIARIYCFNCFAEIHTHGFCWTKEEAIAEVKAAWNRRAQSMTEYKVSPELDALEIEKKLNEMNRQYISGNAIDGYTVTLPSSLNPPDWVQTC